MDYLFLSPGRKEMELALQNRPAPWVPQMTGPFPVPPQTSIPTSSSCIRLPESYHHMEGMPPQPPQQPPQIEKPASEPRQPKKRKRATIKTRRNLGLEYTSSSERPVPSRRQLRKRCDGTLCTKRNLHCATITDEDRQTVCDAFWNLGDLQQQRYWISRHVTATPSGKETSRKSQTLTYQIPHGRDTLPVCRVFFLHTMNVSERFIRTVLAKQQGTGVLDGEKRGGRRMAYTDAVKRQSILEHIARFPRVESHQCRANSSREYLSSDLTIRKMYIMYKEQWDVIPVSYELYKTVFNEQNLGFHVPKKDTCGVCGETKRVKQKNKTKSQGKVSTTCG